MFSHDIMAAILVSRDNKATAMLVSQANPGGGGGEGEQGLELFFNVNTFFFLFQLSCMTLATFVKTLCCLLWMRKSGKR